MNIFYLAPSPIIAARSHCDKHVIKMIVEYAQMLSTAHYCCNSADAYKLYKPTHINHPSNRWVRYCRENYVWLFRCYRELCSIYTAATGKTHKSAKLMTTLMFPPQLLPFATTEPRCMFETDIPNVSPVPQCMPDCYKVVDCSVAAYRNYYCADKSRIATFKYNQQPVWMRFLTLNASDLRTTWLTDVPESLSGQLSPTVAKPTPRKYAPFKPQQLTGMTKHLGSNKVAKLRPQLHSLSALTALLTPKV